MTLVDCEYIRVLKRVHSNWLKDMMENITDINYCCCCLCDWQWYYFHDHCHCRHHLCFIYLAYWDDSTLSGWKSWRRTFKIERCHQCVSQVCASSFRKRKKIRVLSIESILSKIIIIINNYYYYQYYFASILFVFISAALYSQYIVSELYLSQWSHPLFRVK